jgi:hypothetical protein
MELSLSWETVSHAATQELSNILWNPKIHYRDHKIPPLIHTTPSYLSKIHFNIIHPPYLNPPGTSSLFGPNFLNTLYSNILKSIFLP